MITYEDSETEKVVDLSWFLGILGSGCEGDGARIVMTAASFLQVRRDYTSRDLTEAELRARIGETVEKLSREHNTNNRDNLAYSLLADVIYYIDYYCDKEIPWE